ncbi:MAG: DUF2064 domain-containing protein [Candidatus Hydrogenedens sp.]|nr:DUF2064 domain-containing protein [Candidatus Hydrogenedens sp.]
MTDRLIVFTKYPMAGKVKTRLIGALTPEDAAGVHRAMAEHTVRHAIRLRRSHGTQIEVRFAGCDSAEIASWLGSNVDYAPQGEGDLGARMARAMQAAFDDGIERVVIVGTDCPALDHRVMQSAFAALDDSDGVIGPARDGGYYLIGLRSGASVRALPGLFEGPAWGTDTVLRTTMGRAEALGISLHALEPLHDVDRPADLPVWESLRTKECALPQISVIVAARNEEDSIASTLRTVLHEPDTEVILADGGSKDETVAIGEALGARVVAAEGGRAAQMNAAARSTHGSILLFLHADTLLPVDWAHQMSAALEQPGVSAGAFTFATDGTGAALRMLEWLVDLRSRWLQRPYGDQGLYLRKTTFEAAGGYPEWPLMDDYELVRRLARRGRIAVVPGKAITSARRWRRIGVLRAMLLNQTIIAAFHLGVPPETLARWYRGAGRKPGENS